MIYYHIMITFIAYENGVEISKIKLSERKTSIERFKAKALMCKIRRLKQFNIEDAKIQLSHELKNFDKVNEILNLYGALGEQALELLYDLNDQNNKELNDLLFSVEFPSTNREKVLIPEVLKPLLEIHDNTHGRAVGKGEILSCLLFKDVTGKPNAEYDIFHQDSPWHMKDHRISSATPLGRPDGEKKNKNAKFDWRQADIIQFCWTKLKKVGVKKNFGIKEFTNNEQLTFILEALKEKYNTQNVNDVLIMFENDLNVVASKSLGDAKGVLFVKQECDNPYFERVDASDICFYSLSQDNLKITDFKGRYVDAVMAKIDELKRLEEEKKALELKKVKTFEKFKEFERSWNNATTIRDISNSLSKTPTAVRQMKEQIIKKYPEQFSFKKLERANKKSLSL